MGWVIAERRRVGRCSLIRTIICGTCHCSHTWDGVVGPRLCHDDYESRLIGDNP